MYIILAIVVVLVIVIGGYFYYVNNKKNDRFFPLPVPSNLDLSVLKTTNDPLWPASIKLAQDNLSLKKYENFLETKNLDLEYLKKNAGKAGRAGTDEPEYSLFYEKDDHSVSKIFGNTDDGFVEELFLPTPSFLRIHKKYYADGQLQEIGGFIGHNKNTRMGIWKFYDTKGTLIKETKEDERYGKFGYGELLAFLHLNKFINLEIGENRDFLISYNEKIKQWGVYVMNNNYIVSELALDGDTGKVISGKQYQGGII